MRPSDEEDVLVKILDLYASRPELDVAVLGLLVDTLHYATYYRSFDDQVRARNYWFMHMLSHDVKGRPALEIACAMFGKFNSLNEGIDWLNGVPEGLWLPRIERVKMYSAQELLSELRGMTPATI